MGCGTSRTLRDTVRDASVLELSTPREMLENDTTHLPFEISIGNLVNFPSTWKDFIVRDRSLLVCDDVGRSNEMPATEQQ